MDRWRNNGLNHSYNLHILKQKSGPKRARHVLLVRLFYRLTLLAGKVGTMTAPDIRNPANITYLLLTNV